MCLINMDKWICLVSVVKAFEDVRSGKEEDNNDKRLIILEKSNVQISSVYTINHVEYYLWWYII